MVFGAVGKNVLEFIGKRRKKSVSKQKENTTGRARNSHLQTRKMRVEIQFCELKILALVKSCEFNNLPVANTKSYLGLKDVYK